MSRNEEALNDVRRKISEVMKKESTKTVFGWRPPTIERKEGDTWVDDDGKKWEVKHGIKQSISKLQDAKTPWFCPTCSKIMPHEIDTRMYRRFNMCLDCVAKRETKMKANGTWEAWSKKTRKANYIAYLEDKLAELTDYYENVTAPEMIHADSEKILMIEKWGIDLEKVRADILEEITKLKDHIETIRDSDE